LTTVKKLLSENVPYNAKVSFGNTMAGQGWNASPYSSFLKEAIQ
jgi:hypothetical protein